MDDGDQAAPPAESPAFLLRLLRKTLVARPSLGPGREPQHIAQRIMRQLEHLGIDGAPYVRYGMADLYASGILASVLVSYNPRKDGGLPLDIEGWKSALAAPSVEDPDDIDVTWAIESYPRLQARSIYGALDDVLSLQAPTRDEFNALDAIDPSEAELVRKYTWIVDRTAGVPLERWGRTALHFEYRWQEGKLPSPAPLAIMDSVRVNPNELRRVIAHDAVYAQIDEESSHYWRLHNGMYHQAKSFLMQNRHAEASALYEYLIGQRPTDADAANNLGFCVLPLDRARAIDLFQRAKENGYDNAALLLYNRLCAERDSERIGSLLVEIEHYWTSALSENPHSCTIWIPQDDGTFHLEDTLDVRIDLAREVAIAYRGKGRFDRVSIWTDRLEQLNTSASPKPRSNPQIEP